MMRQMVLRARGRAELWSHWLRNTAFRSAYAQYTSYQKESGSGHALILCGYPKSGNTWLRLLYHNLINVTLNDACDTLTYSRLNEVQNNMFFPTEFASGKFTRPDGFSHGRFPIMFHSHVPWTPLWNAFGKVLFVYRNPLDTMVSMWYATVHFRKDQRGVISIDDFAKANIVPWMQSFTMNMRGADVTIAYEDMRRSPRDVFGDGFDRLGISFEPSALERAIDLSTFSSVRTMEEVHNERHGHQKPGNWFEEDNIRFTRSGKTGQWKSALSSDTIDFCLEALADGGIDHRSLQFESPEAGADAGESE
jgi:hypothetical protein